MPLPTKITWIVLANAERFRVFEERHHGAPLQELAEDARRAAANRRDVEETEERFLRRLAEDLRRAAAEGRYERLILIAPPKALGYLKAELGEVGAKRLERTEARDIVEDETAETLRLHVRDIRLPA